MHVVRHVLRAGLWVTFALLITAARLRRRHAGPPGPLEAQRRLEPGCRLEGLRIPGSGGTGVLARRAALPRRPPQVCQGDRPSPDRADGGGRQDHPLRRRGPDLLPGCSRVRDGVLGGRLEVLAYLRGNELIIQEKNEFGKLVQSLSLNREGRLAVRLSLDDRRLRAPLLLKRRRPAPG